MVIALDTFGEAAVLVAAIALLIIGLTAAWSSANVARRIAGIVIALTGAVAALAALGAPAALAVAALGILFAHVALGVVVLVRLQEAYGVTETPDIDNADEQAEALERAG